MSRTVRRHRLVWRDVIDSAAYIERDSLDAALRFFSNVETTLNKLAEMPTAGALRELQDVRLSNLRSWPVDGFPNHLIFYQPTAQGVYVLAIIHGARDLLSALEDRV